MEYGFFDCAACGCSAQNDTEKQMSLPGAAGCRNAVKKLATLGTRVYNSKKQRKEGFYEIEKAYFRNIGSYYVAFGFSLV